uniref:Ice-structuring protein 4-like n=1 Tax=Rhabditophanes sp. KR3021 TaxID=114890 RepID=A0AC35UFZ9_9BILA
MDHDSQDDQELMEVDSESNVTIIEEASFLAYNANAKPAGSETGLTAQSPACVSALNAQVAAKEAAAAATIVAQTVIDDAKKAVTAAENANDEAAKAAAAVAKKAAEDVAVILQQTVDSACN